MPSSFPPDSTQRRRSRCSCRCCKGCMSLPRLPKTCWQGKEHTSWHRGSGRTIHSRKVSMNLGPSLGCTCPLGRAGTHWRRCWGYKNPRGKQHKWSSRGRRQKTPERRRCRRRALPGSLPCRLDRASKGSLRLDYTSLGCSRSSHQSRCPRLCQRCSLCKWLLPRDYIFQQCTWRRRRTQPRKKSQASMVHIDHPLSG
jgi:hypothetical protein